MTFTNFALDLSFIIVLSLIPVALSYFLDFILGYPGKEDPGPNTHAIFFGWTLFLAKRRLNSIAAATTGSQSMLVELESGFFAMLNSENFTVRRTARHQLKVAIIVKAREMIGWEHAAGFCIYCTNVWISGMYCGIVIFLFKPVLYVIPIIFLPLLTIFFSHLLLRKINS